MQRFLDDEALRLRSYLERDGYFGGSVTIIPRQGPRPHWVDLDVRLRLGRWYRLGGVKAEGNHAISDDELFLQFQPDGHVITAPFTLKVA